MNFTAPAELVKSETRVDGQKIHILIKASDESLDAENDNILSEAFTPEVRAFMLEKGVIDYDHITVRGANALEKATAIIGTPTEFYQELVKGRPVQFIRGFLHRGNPFVDSTIAPGLESGSDRWGASIGGKMLAWNKNEQGGKRANKIWMNHIAITPAFKAVNPNTAVQILKSKDGDEIHQFASMNSLLKALEAGSQTDSAQITGAQALQPQSLEQKPATLTITKDILQSIINDIVDGHCNFSERPIAIRASVYGLNEQLAEKVVHVLMGAAMRKRIQEMMHLKRTHFLRKG